MKTDVHEVKVTPLERMMFKKIEESVVKKKHYCDPHCGHLKDDSCGNSYFEHVTSSSGRWVKEIDSRCWER